MTGSSIGGLLLGAIARPPLAVLKVAGSVPALGLAESIFFVPTDEDQLALTFDDGPHPDTTQAVLARLGLHDCRATFFLHGGHAERYPGLVNAILAEGHEIANHTWEDKTSWRLAPTDFRRSLDATHDVLSRLAFPHGKDVTFFRPAGGIPTRTIVSYAKSEHDYRTVLASLYPFDPHVPASLSTWIAEAVTGRAHRGAVVVLHEGRGRARVATILDRALPRLRERFVVGTVSELLSSAS